MTPLESFYPRTEWLPWSRYIPGENDSSRVVPSQDRMTPLETFHQGQKDSISWIYYISVRIDSPGVVPSQDRMSPLESFYPRTVGLPRSCSILGQKDSPGVVLSQDRMTPQEAFHSRTE